MATELDAPGQAVRVPRRRLDPKSEQVTCITPGIGLKFAIIEEILDIPAVVGPCYRVRPHSDKSRH